MSRPRKRKPKKNAYLPTLVRMHERWSPEQIADVLWQAELAFKKPLSAFVVDRLAQMPQVDQGSYTAPPPTFENSTVETEDAVLGKCEGCHHYNATTVIELPTGVKRVCARCYSEYRNLRVTKEEPNVEGPKDDGEPEHAG